MLDKIKKIAFEKVKKTKNQIPFNEFESYLKDWWSNKFNLPTNHPLLLELTFEELALQYFTDLFRKDEEEYSRFELEVSGKHVDSDEEWLMKEMGEEYKPPEEAKDNEENDLIFNDKYTMG